MRFKLLLKTTALTALLIIAGKVGWAQTTYVWNQTSGGVYSTAANWTPTRTTPATTDILTFTDGGTYTVTGVATETIGKLLISNNTKVTLQPIISTTSQTLTINNSDVSVDLDVPNSCELNVSNFYLSTTGSIATGSPNITNIASITGVLPGMLVTGTGIPASTTVSSTSGTGPYTIVMSVNATATNAAASITVATSPLIIALATSTTASISGSMSFSGAAHRLTATSTSAITFNNGSIFTADANFNGSAFGTAAGNANTIIFASGSKYVAKAGSNPFGVSAPASAVIFQSGSTFSLEASLTPSLSNRTYANFVVNYTGAAIAPSGTAPCRIDNLTILSGSVGITTALPILISNDLSVSSGASFNYSPASANTTGMIFCGSGTQSINNAGTLTLGANANLIVKEGSNLMLSSDVTALGKLTVAGTLNTADKIVSGATGSFVSGNSSVTLTGTLATSTNGLTGLTSTTGVEPGMLVTGNAAIPANTFVTSTSGTTTVFFTNYPTSAVASATLSFTRVAGTVKSGHANGLDGSIAVSGTKTFDANTSFEFNGTSAQVTGALLPATVKNLTINNAAGVAMTGSTTVNGILNFNSGKLDIGANDLTIGSAGSITNNSSSKYVVESGVGMLKMNTLGTTGSVTYPVGPSATSYTQVVSTDNTSTDLLGVHVKTGITNTTLDNNKCVNLEWQATEGVPGGNTGTITFQWNASDEGTGVSHANPFKFATWDGAKYNANTVTVLGSDPYTVTIPAPDIYPAYPSILGNSAAFGADAPVLTADAVDIYVDNNIDITFTDDAAWRAAITAVKDGSTTLTATTDYTIAAGMLTLTPKATNTLSVPGTRTITVIATGYLDATVSQDIFPGVPTIANSTITNTPAMGLGVTSTVTLTAKDQFNNPVPNYLFRYDATITDGVATTTESYMINGVAKTSTATDILLTATNGSGVTTFDIIVPGTVDATDGISVQVQLNDGTTNLGSALEYFTPAGPSLAGVATLTELNLNGATIALTVLSETFADAILSAANFSLNNAPSGVSISSVTYLTNTTATVTLAYDGTDFDANVTNFSVTVAGSELTLGNPLTTNNLTITAVVETVPVLTTNAAITTNGLTTATWGGDVSATGGEAVTEKGICWATSLNPTIANDKTTEGAGIGAITGNMTGLTANTLYHVRAYATNSVGTNYGDDFTFTTWAPAPTFTATYPQSKNIVLTGFDVVVNTNAAGKVYFLRLASGAAAPTSAVVKSTGTLINIIAPATEYSATVTGLTQGTSYDVYFVTENSDATVLLDTPVKLTVTTTSVPTVTCYQIQHTTDASGNSPYMNQTVKTSGIVTGIKLGTSGTQTSFWIQDAAGGWNGVYVYSATPTVAIGDLVNVTGQIVEYNGLTEFSSTGTVVTITNSGNTVPSPAVVTTLASNDEQYESVLVTVNGATCTGSPATGTFNLNDGSGVVAAYKALFATLALTTNNKYNVTGIMYWYYSATATSMWELYPRSAADVSDVTGINDNENNNFRVFPNPFTNEIRFEGIENVKQVTITTITGQMIKNEVIGQANVISTSELPKGMYIITFMNDKGEKTTKKMVKQ